MLHSTWLQDHSEIDDDITSTIKDMVKERGNTCVSIIVPTHRLGSDRQGDLAETERAIFAAKQEVKSGPGNILLAMDELFQQIDFKRNQEGIGIFVSPHIKKLVRFPFPVIKKIIVNESFHLHELLYIENYKVVYYLLDISKKEVHLFRGVMDHLEEIKDENFPVEIIQEYEYQKPSPSASGKGYAQVKDVEKDKSILEQMRLKKILQKTDKLLSKYIKAKTVPLLLCGPEKDLSIYKSVTDHPESIVASISDNHKGASIHDLEILAWLQMRSFIDAQKRKAVDELTEKIGEGLGVCGVEEVWTAAKEGRGLVLLVEKDYGKAAFVTPDNKLYEQHPDSKYVRYPDVVNEIMTTVLEKHGNVVVVEKDALKDHKRIALILRY